MHTLPRVHESKKKTPFLTLLKSIGRSNLKIVQKSQYEPEFWLPYCKKLYSGTPNSENGSSYSFFPWPLKVWPPNSWPGENSIVKLFYTYLQFWPIFYTIPASTLLNSIYLPGAPIEIEKGIFFCFERCNYNNKKLKKRAKKAIQKRGSLKDVRYKMTRMRRPCTVHSGFFFTSEPNDNIH